MNLPPIDRYPDKPPISVGQQLADHGTGANRSKACNFFILSKHECSDVVIRIETSVSHKRRTLLARPGWLRPDRIAWLWPDCSSVCECVHNDVSVNRMSSPMYLNGPLSSHDQHVDDSAVIVLAISLCQLGKLFRVDAAFAPSRISKVALMLIRQIHTSRLIKWDAS